MKLTFAAIQARIYNGYYDDEFGLANFTNEVAVVVGSGKSFELNDLLTHYADLPLRQRLDESLSDLLRMHNLTPAKLFAKAAEEHLTALLELIKSAVPQRGDKVEDCQQMTLMQALKELEAAVNGTQDADCLAIATH